MEMRSVEAKMEEIVWAQPSRATWLKHGDQNTTFFHRKATERKKRNFIDLITDDHEVEYADEEEIEDVLTGYFQGLFTLSESSDYDEITFLVAGRVNPEHVADLSVPYTAEEVNEALFEMHPSKALGRDGMPALFSFF